MAKIAWGVLSRLRLITPRQHCFHNVPLSLRVIEVTPLGVHREPSKANLEGFVTSVTRPACALNCSAMWEENESGNLETTIKSLSHDLSTLAEVALQDPSAIKSMITNNGNGTYGVRFFVDGRAEYVTVNNELPVVNDGKDWNNGSTFRPTRTSEANVAAEGQ